MEQKAHILFVDDEQLLHGLFERLFARHGMKVSCCSDATQAVEELKSNSYDLVVTDFMMPDMDGLELLSYIRNDHPQTKVIMITAHSNVQHAVRSMKMAQSTISRSPFRQLNLLSVCKSASQQRMKTYLSLRRHHVPNEAVHGLVPRRSSMLVSIFPSGS